MCSCSFSVNLFFGLFVLGNLRHNCGDDFLFYRGLNDLVGDFMYLALCTKS